MLDKSNIKEGLVYSGSQLEGTVHHGGDGRLQGYEAIAELQPGNG